MTRFWALLVCAFVLAGIVAVELRPSRGQGGALALPAPLPAAARSALPPLPAAPKDLVGVALARPLFAATRRPPAVRAGRTAAVAAALPRIAGIVTDNGQRRVIFAASAEGGRPLVVSEGADVNGFKVEAIEAGQVRVSGPDGLRVLRPSFALRAPGGAPSTALPATRPPGLPNPSNLTGIPGLDAPVTQ